MSCIKCHQMGSQHNDLHDDTCQWHEQLFWEAPVTGHHKSFWGIVKLFASITRPLPISLVYVWLLVMTTIYQLQLCCTGNDEGLGYWSAIDHPDQWRLLFLFLWKVELCFFSWANERESDPVKKCVLARHIVYVLVIELAVLMGHGNKGALQKHHFSTRTLPPCGHRSKATMGLRKKENI